MGATLQQRRLGSKKPNVKQFYERFRFEDMLTNPPKPILDFLDGEKTFLQERLKPGKRILEIGCGYGRLLGLLSDRARKVVGIDFSRSLLKRAKQNTSDLGNLQLFLMDATNLGFADSSFDYALCADSGFGNMPGIENQVLSEIVRVTKPGGQIVISVFSENAKEAQIDNYQRIGLQGIWDDGTAIHTDEGFYSRRFSRDDLSGLFAELGLSPSFVTVCNENHIAIAKK
jgi:ubiquinone/menaquinone biosynthesis C-methylase UbiE